MEMSLNRTSVWRRPPVPSPWLRLAALWALLLPIQARAATPSNGTLLFDGGGGGAGVGGGGLRNCSCPTVVRPCDEARANLLCSCHSVPRASLPAAGGLWGAPLLSVWASQPWVLAELLHGSQVSDLRLSYCGAVPLPPSSLRLALFGLRRLRVHSALPGAPHPDQEISIASAAGGGKDRGGGGGGDEDSPPPSSSADPSSSSVLHVVVLDLAVLNGLSALKTYSVAGPTVPTLAQHFPLLALPPAPAAAPRDPQDTLPSDPPQDCLLTFIY